MSKIGQRERATQNRAENSNIEEGYLSGWLAK